MTTSEKLLPTSDEIIDAHNHNVIRHIYLVAIKKLLEQDNIDDAYKALDMYAAKVNTRITAQDRWRPISEAPRDGAWILAYCPTLSITKFPTVVFADDCSEHDIWYMPNDLDYGCVYPTHFMPLPQPPKSEE